MVSQLIINILINFCIYVLIAFSFVLIYSTSKFFNIAHAAVISVGAYLTYFFFSQLALSIWLSVPFAIFLTILVGSFFELFIYKPLRRKNTSSLKLLIVSLGIYIIIQNCISIFWGDATKIIKIEEIKVGNEILGMYITNVQIIIIIVCFLIYFLNLFFLKYHKLGKNIRAVASNAELANIMGVNSDKIILFSFIIGSGIAAISGILIASDTGLTPTMGFNLLLYGIVAMIIGGVGSKWGLIFGAFLLALSQNLIAYYIDSKWMDAITYIIMIVFLIWKPLGFSGNKMKKIDI